MPYWAGRGIEVAQLNITAPTNTFYFNYLNNRV